MLHQDYPHSPASVYMKEIVQDFPSTPAIVQFEGIVQEILPYTAAGHAKEICVCPELGHQHDIPLTHALS